MMEVAMIKDEELSEKAECGEGLTVEEVKRNQELVKPVHHVYGKFGTRARSFPEEQPAKLWAIENVPAYLHKADEQAEEL